MGRVFVLAGIERIERAAMPLDPSHSSDMRVEEQSDLDPFLSDHRYRPLSESSGCHERGGLYDSLPSISDILDSILLEKKPWHGMANNPYLATTFSFLSNNTPLLFN